MKGAYAMKKSAIGKFAVLAAAVAVSACAFATDYTWTGAVNNSWTNKNNWSGNVAPAAGANNRVIFDTPGTLYVRNVGMSSIPSTVIVKQGNVTLGGKEPYTSNGSVGATPLVFDIYEGATLLASNRLERSSCMNVTKIGKGTLKLTRPCGADSGYYPLGTVDVKEGEIVYQGDANWLFYCTNLVVRKDAVFNCTKNNGIRSKTGTKAKPCLVTVEKGGTLKVVGGGTAMTVSALAGEGTIQFSGTSSTEVKLAPDSSLGFCVFSGNFTPTGKAKVTLTAGSTGIQTIGAANTFGDIYSFTADGNNIAFAPGVVGEFKIVGLTVRSGTRLNLEDTDGNPVSVSVSGANTVRTSGSGSIKFTSDRSVLGDALAHTGKLSASAVLTFGDGASAANDADLSTVSSITSTTDIKIKNAADTTLSVPSVTTTGISLSGDAAAAVIVSNGCYSAAPSMPANDSSTKLKIPAGTKIIGATADATLRQVGGEVYVAGSTQSMPDNYELLGGKLSVIGTVVPYSTSRTANLLLNGGTLSFNFRNNQYGFSPFDASKNFNLSVGAKGVVLADEQHVNTTAKIALEVPISSGVEEGVDGGITQKTRMCLELSRPISITGPYRLMDGQIGITSACDLETTPSALGTGDFVLGNSRLFFWHMTYNSRTSTSRTLALASGEGSRLVAAGASELFYTPNSSDAPQHVTAGALARTRGGVLFLSDAKSSRFDGTADTASLRFTGTIPSVRACGILSDPVLVSDASINADNYRSSGGTFQFATVNEEGYVKKFTGYKTSLSDDVDSVFRLTERTTLNAGADISVGSILGFHCEFALNAGSRLRVGDGTNPGIAVLETVAATGSGTLDFGTTEGVIVMNTMGTSDGMFLPWTIAGQDGVSFVATPWTGRHRLNLSGAANWSGTTTINAMWVDPRNNTSLGSKVVVGAGKRCGGTLVFGRATTFTSDIEAAGWGVQLYTYDSVHTAAAVVFENDATVTGNVKLMDETRIIAKGSDVRGTISGVVSGDRLSVYRGSGTLVLTGDNTYTNGTLVRQSTLALGKASSAGTGPITLDGGTLAFENSQSATFTNTLSGVGTVALKGTAPVLFRCDKSGLDAPLDLCGTKQTFTEMPPFGAITNSLTHKATIALAGGLGRVDWPDWDFGGKISLAVGEGTVLDLGGRTINVYRLEADTAGRVVNGIVNEASPLVGLLMLVK